ncbi:hypothetical protein LZ31DRAFT_548896 [Colletotrichum somersetense]|nr:hypothetical protein LZ31DRAFT_548896 [Colletotrichum somersetense]
MGHAGGWESPGIPVLAGQPRLARNPNSLSLSVFRPYAYSILDTAAGSERTSGGQRREGETGDDATMMMMNKVSIWMTRVRSWYVSGQVRGNPFETLPAFYLAFSNFGGSGPPSGPAQYANSYSSQSERIYGAAALHKTTALGAGYTLRRTWRVFPSYTLGALHRRQIQLNGSSRDASLLLEDRDGDG